MRPCPRSNPACVMAFRKSLKSSNKRVPIMINSNTPDTDELTPQELTALEAITPRQSPSLSADFNARLRQRAREELKHNNRRLRLRPLARFAALAASIILGIFIGSQLFNSHGPQLGASVA